MHPDSRKLELPSHPGGSPLVKPLMRWVLRTVGAMALAVFGFAGYWTVRIALADWIFLTGTPQAIRHAIRLSPGNPAYLSSLAQADPGAAVDEIETAVELSPADSGLRIELGLAFEERGDFVKAEANLEKALDLDKTFAPRYVLSEFYVRRHNSEKFWPVAKSALAISYADVSALFRDCWTLSSDAGAILENAIPDRPPVLTAYLNFLLGEGRLAAAAPVAEKVLAKATSESVTSLLSYCDHLLEAGEAEDAVAVWKELSQRKLVPYAVPSAEGPDILTNGDFHLPGIASAFDWRFSAPGGIYIHREGRPPAISVSFTGKQPESTEILSQYVALLPLRKYELSVRYGTKEIGAESGLKCLLVPFKGADLLDGAGLLPGGIEGDTERAFHFVTGKNTKIARLVVAYQRMQGTMRIEGRLILRRFSLGPTGGEFR